MAHSILITDVVELITVNGSQYELDMYSEITGLTRQELMSSASLIETHSAYSEVTQDLTDLSNLPF